MFGDLKHEGEQGYDPSIHHSLTDHLDNENMETVVKILFKKAQEEKIYLVFYGKVCEDIIMLELALRKGYGVKKKVTKKQ
jgi:hypothetical protein